MKHHTSRERRTLILQRRFQQLDSPPPMLELNRDASGVLVLFTLLTFLGTAGILAALFCRLC